jgi:hypothetical protein
MMQEGKGQGCSKVEVVAAREVGRGQLQVPSALYRHAGGSVAAKDIK